MRTAPTPPQRSIAPRLLPRRRDPDKFAKIARNPSRLGSRPPGGHYLDPVMAPH
jgi:hypothetical protein